MGRFGWSKGRSQTASTSCSGAPKRRSFVPDDARSPAGFERVEIDGERCVIKYVHPDYDFTMRVSGDLGCRPRACGRRG